jgi:IS5 family transposase
MDLWKILVLGTLRLNCNWDYDKLRHISNEHKTVREFLGPTIYEFDQRYSLQSLKDNLALFTPELLDQNNQVVVRAGHDRVGGPGEFRLKGRCDSFVVETNVHYPTDINLMLDAIRKVVFLIGGLGDQLGITDWRQYRHIFKKIGSNSRWCAGSNIRHQSIRFDVAFWRVTPLPTRRRCFRYLKSIRNGFLRVLQSRQPQRSGDVVG